MIDGFQGVLRRVIAATIALALVVVSSAHLANPAQAVEKPQSSHSHGLSTVDHINVKSLGLHSADCDKSEQESTAIPSESEDGVCSGACCEGSCVPLVAFSSGIADVTSSLRDTHRILLSDGASGHSAFDFLRPPRT
jgi:hypothetical protein